jgi:hypothetical protein
MARGVAQKDVLSDGAQRPIARNQADIGETAKLRSTMT